MKIHDFCALSTGTATSCLQFELSVGGAIVLYQLKIPDAWDTVSQVTLLYPFILMLIISMKHTELILSIRLAPSAKLSIWVELQPVYKLRARRSLHSDREQISSTDLLDTLVPDDAPARHIECTSGRQGSRTLSPAIQVRIFQPFSLLVALRSRQL